MGHEKSTPQQRGKPQTSTFSRQPDNTSTTNATNSQRLAAPVYVPARTPTATFPPSTQNLRNTNHRHQHQPAQALRHSDRRAPSSPPLPSLPKIITITLVLPHHHATQDLMPPNPTYHHQRARPHSRKKIPTCPATRAASFHPPPPQLHNAPHCTRTAPRIYRESGVR